MVPPNFMTHRALDSREAASMTPETHWNSRSASFLLPVKRPGHEPGREGPRIPFLTANTIFPSLTASGFLLGA